VLWTVVREALACALRGAIVLAGVSFVVFLAVASPAGAARWYEDYERAVELIDQGGCSLEAIQLLGATVVDKPKARRQARTVSVRVIEYYVPYYQLARANLACGNLDAARQYLDRSRSEGVAPSDWLDSISAELESVATSVTVTPTPSVDRAEYDRRVRQVEESMARAAEELQRIGGLLADPDHRQVRSRQSERYDQAARDLANARSKLTAAKEGLNALALADALVLTNRDIQVLASIAGEIESNAERLRRERERPTSTPRPLIEPLPPSPTARPTSAPLRPSPTPAVVEPVERPLARRLRLAAASYLERDYETVLRSLSDITSQSARERAVAHLMRAAAHHALYRLGGEQETSELEASRREILACREIDPEVEPDARFFSPAFRALFKEAS
jgi:hypothetical protein